MKTNVQQEITTASRCVVTQQAATIVSVTKDTESVRIGSRVKVKGNLSNLLLRSKVSSVSEQSCHQRLTPASMYITLSG